MSVGGASRGFVYRMYRRPLTLFLCRALFVTEAVTHGPTERQRDRETDAQVKEVLASWSTSKRTLERRVRLLLEVKRVRCWEEVDGSILCQSVWFEAKYVEGNGLMIGQRG